MTVQTIFNVNGNHYAVDAVGQDAAAEVRREMPRQFFTIVGFLVNEKFIPVDLTSHWQRTSFKK